ncbi:MAG: DUF2752 domain-containing protein [Verrucomicrobiales bacterium]|nr:DUF2752 domain-containing protein [Verrucomicrobiales bacterium]
MIQLVKTDRKPNFDGVTPAFLVGATLFFAAILAGHFLSRHYETSFTTCLFKRITHQPCVLCGGTRASLSLAAGDPVEAVKYNPLVTAVLSYIGFAMFLKFALGRKLILNGFAADRRFLWSATLVIVIANWIYILRTLG